MSVVVRLLLHHSLAEAGAAMATWDSGEVVKMWAAFLLLGGRGMGPTWILPHVVASEETRLRQYQRQCQGHRHCQRLVVAVASACASAPSRVSVSGADTDSVHIQTQHTPEDRGTALSLHHRRTRSSRRSVV